MTVGELVNLLKEEDQSLEVEVSIKIDDESMNNYGPITSVEIYEDSVELWIR